MNQLSFAEATEKQDYSMQVTDRFEMFSINVSRERVSSAP